MNTKKRGINNHVRRFVCISFLVLEITFAYAQTKRDTISVNEYIYNATYKNIAAYCIKSERYFRSKILDKNNQLNTETGFFFDLFLPDYGYRLKMDIDKSALIYPRTEYELFQIYIKKWSFVNELKSIEKRHLVTDEQEFPLYSHYLIAINNKNRNIKFVSGEFHTTPISKDFSFDIGNPDSFLEYIKIKLFYLQTKNLAFVKKKGKKMYYKAYSEEIKKDVSISISLNDIENSLHVNVPK